LRKGKRRERGNRPPARKKRWGTKLTRKKAKETRKSIKEKNNSDGPINTDSKRGGEGE